MSNLKYIISHNLIELRKKSHLTQAELAEKMNYSDKTVSKWETGETTPNIEVLQALALFYNVSIDDLVSENFNINQTVSIKERKVSHVAIMLLSIFSVWLLASALFTFFLWSKNATLIKTSWLFFIYSIPISCILSVIGISVWGQKRKYGWITLFSSLLAWSVILCIYLSLLVIPVPSINIWMLWIIGVPIQIILILAFRINKK